MHIVFRSLSLSLMFLGLAASAFAQARAVLPPVPTPTDVKPGSISCDECPYPYPSNYLDISVYSQDVRISYMDIAAQGAPNGHSVLLLHGNNFGGFYFKAIIDGLTREGFRVVVPDQIGYGRSSKPIMQYTLSDMARNSRAILTSLKIEKVMVIGHSMGGMLSARFASLYPDVVERLLVYNPIGLVDTRHGRAGGNVDEQYKGALNATYASVKAGLMRYVAHNPAAWNDEFEKYARIRYAWTLGADWPRLAMVQTLTGALISGDPVVYDWAHIKAPTLAFGGAEDVLPGSAKLFQERMKVLADTVPNGNGKLQLIAGLGHVPHLEDAAKTIPPMVAFLKAGV